MYNHQLKSRFTGTNPTDLTACFAIGCGLKMAFFRLFRMNMAVPSPELEEETHTHAKTPRRRDWQRRTFYFAPSEYFAPLREASDFFAGRYKAVRITAMNRSIRLRLVAVVIAFFVLAPVSISLSQSVNPHLLDQRWKAQWIAYPDGPRREFGVFHFRKSFSLA